MTLTLETTSPTDSAHPLRAAEPLDVEEFSRIRRHMLLHCCKWDPQVGDVATLASFPLVMPQREWRRICSDAERLSAELLEAEMEILDRPELHGLLGIPKCIRRLLNRTPTPAALRVMRFDFHFTRDGWRISEVNADVPGGFAEASAFTQQMADRFPGLAAPGNPAGCWARTLLQGIEERRDQVKDVALLSAPGFMEDFQVVSYLSRVLEAHGLHAHLAQPAQIRWIQGHAHLRTAWHDGPLAAIVRFYQAEWLGSLPRRVQWQPLLIEGRTPVCNPIAAVISESKRFPLLWHRLRSSLPTWRRLCPQTLGLREAPWQRDESWLIKCAYCNTGDAVFGPGLSGPKQWRRARWHAKLFPQRWIAQRRFHVVPVDTVEGEMYPCIGVYTIDGRAEGAYTRISPRPIIDYRSIDAALLIAPDGSPGEEA